MVTLAASAPQAKEPKGALMAKPLAIFSLRWRKVKTLSGGSLEDHEGAEAKVKLGTRKSDQTSGILFKFLIEAFNGSCSDYIQWTDTATNPIGKRHSSGYSTLLHLNFTTPPCGDELYCTDVLRANVHIYQFKVVLLEEYTFKLPN